MDNPIHIGLGMNVGMKLEQKLSPQMIQSLKLLQVTALQLEAMVVQELETNPLLEKSDDIQEEEKVETTETEKDAQSPEKENDGEFKELKTDDSPNDVDWESFFEDGFDPGYRRSEDLSSQENRFERVPVASKSLQDHLQFQLIYRHIPVEIRILVEYLINSLDDDGYLKTGAENQSVDEVLEAAASEGPQMREIQEIIYGLKEESQSSKDVREAFNVLRALEPPGIGARDLRECLLLQMRRLGNCTSLAQRIVEEEFELLEKLKVSILSKKLERSLEEIQTALGEIGGLEPRPGRIFSVSSSTPVIPDLIVEVIDGQIILLFNDKFTPSLRISRNYSKLLKKGSTATSEEKKYVRDKLNSASWLIKAIEQRKSTMLKVMNAIIESQPAFFSEGPTHLRPLILQDIADKISMHISTVSRVINGKYVQTHNGIFELKYFFTSGVSQEDGTEVSSVTMKNEIRTLVESEDPKKPLSDQKISDILKSKGFNVARRTVAKYRDQMEILPTRLRKKF